MNAFIIIGIAVFIAAFGSVLALNSTAIVQGRERIVFTPPYQYDSVNPEAVGFINAFLFVVVVSAVFFGFGVPIALGIEGLKYASLFTTGKMPAFDLFFVGPQILAAYAISLIGKGAVEDYQGRGSVFAYWRDALKWFVASAAILGILILSRKYFVGLV